MNKHIEKARTWLSRPEAEIGTGGRCEIAGLVEEEVWSEEPDFGRIVALCVRRALREEDMYWQPTRVELADKDCKGAFDTETWGCAGALQALRRRP